VRRGLLVEADGGTLFLDEIGDMPQGVQAKLLRVLEDGVVRPVGADVARSVDLRVIAATNQDLEARISEGRFRADLFYRLNVVPIVVPSLRERIQDLPSLVETFVDKARARNPHSPGRAVAPDVMLALSRCSWPGNVRELENVIQRLVIMAADESVTMADLEAHAPHVLEDGSPLQRARRVRMPLKELEREYIAWILDQCGGNKTRAAEILQVDVSTLYRRERGSQ
jgi:two-component system response regulator HydG